MEAYKVGITIALTNHVSKALMLMQKDFTRTDAQAVKLKNTLHAIEKTALKGALMGGVGYAMLAPLKAGYEAAKKYEQAFNQFKQINLGDAINRDADKFATGANVIGASATDLMGTVRDLHTALGDYDMAKALAPKVAQMKWANQSVFGGHGMDFSERQLQAMEKIIEMKGGFHGPADFMLQANMMQRVIGGTGGMVKPSDYMQFIKTAGVSGRLLSNESFYYAMEPLIQEMSGGRVGTGTMSAYNNLAQGRSTVRAATEMMKYGLLDPSMVEYTKIGTIKRIKPGGLAGMDEFTSNPYGWMNDVLLPSLAKKGVTSEKDVLNAMGAIFGNRTGSSLFSLMFAQREKIEKNMAISKNAMGVDQVIDTALKSPQGAEVALGLAWEDLKRVAGESLIPVVIPALLGLRAALKSFQLWAERNPAVMKGLTYALGGLGTALLFSGSVLTLKAAFMGLSMVLGLGGGTGLIGGFGKLAKLIGGSGVGLIGKVAGLGLALGPIGLVAGLIAAAGAVYMFRKEIADLAEKPLRWLGDVTGVSDGYARGQSYIADRIGQPPQRQGAPTTLLVNLDGKTIAHATIPHLDNALSRPSTGTGYFDIGKTMASPGASYGY